MYRGVFNNKPADFIEIASILPLSAIDQLDDINLIVDDRKYIKTHMPVELSSNRELLKTDYFLIEMSGKSVSVKPKKYIYVKELEEGVVLY
jgi:hypothetical protein